MKTKSRRKGLAYIWVVITLLIVIGFVGLAIDVGYALLVGHQLQNAADASALAGALLVQENIFDAQQLAVYVALHNKAGGKTVYLKINPWNPLWGDMIVGFYKRSTRTFTPTVDSPNAVKIITRRTESSRSGPLELLFAPIFGVNDVNLRRSAIAMIGGGTGAGLITLNETEKWTFRMDGTITLDVRDITRPGAGAAIQVNSDSTWALKTDGGPTLLAGEINVCAETVIDPPEFDGEVYTGEPLMPDPLGHIDPPTNWGDDQGPIVVDEGEHTLSPGYYPKGITMTDGSITLEPGIYVIDGTGLTVTGGDLQAENVMFYIVDTTPNNNKPSEVKLTGDGILRVSAMEGGPYKGIAFWQARDNPNLATIVGTDNSGIYGTLYFPAARVNIGGTSDSFSITQLICDSAEISGTGTMTIDYDGRFPAPVTSPFLVE
ncbi:MAG: pilus assembly protein TadG-related protein [Planctomycetota bacterium]|jgi:hypothetical protein